jgi:hypothetical protein
VAEHAALFALHLVLVFGYRPVWGKVWMVGAEGGNMSSYGMLTMSPRPVSGGLIAFDIEVA